MTVPKHMIEHRIYVRAHGSSSMALYGPIMFFTDVSSAMHGQLFKDVSSETSTFFQDVSSETNTRLRMSQAKLAVIRGCLKRNCPRPTPIGAKVRPRPCLAEPLLQTSSAAALPPRTMLQTSVALGPEMPAAKKSPRGRRFGCRRFPYFPA